jgi:hypothetical protein
MAYRIAEEIVDGEVSLEAEFIKKYIKNSEQFHEFFNLLSYQHEASFCIHQKVNDQI